MDSIRGRFQNPLIAMIAGGVIGLILGLIIAWGLWPVEYVDAPIANLREDLQRDYLATTLQVYNVTSDVQEARRRWNEMGPKREQYLQEFTLMPPASVPAERVSQFAMDVQAQGTTPGAVTPAADTDAGGGLLPQGGPWPLILGALCVLTLVIGGLLAYLLINRKGQVSLGRSGSTGGGLLGSIPRPAPRGDLAPAPPIDGSEPPIVQYLTTYTLGNDLYDDSFSIDSPGGEFLGECGVGISETIGVGDPKKVTAFEVWLFDKNDIQTVTKVLMSAHAYQDQSILQRLSLKGEPVLAEPNRPVLLETETLQLEARIVNMNYGQGALPTNSYFEQMTLELQVWPKA